MANRLNPGISFAVALVAVGVVGGLLRLLSDILLPFVAGLGVAYLLNPLANRLERVGLSRTLAAFAIMSSFFVAVIAIVIVLFPLLQSQILDLVSRIPTFVGKFRAWAEPLIQGAIARLPAGTIEQVQSVAGEHAGDILGWLRRALAGLWSGGMALLNHLSLLIIAPIVAFYFLRDWPQVVERLDALIPRDWAPVVREQARAVDAIIAAFVRGQASVCLLLGTLYATGLVLVGLEFGLLVGLTSGLLSFVPYLGTGLGLVVAVSIGFVQFATWTPVFLAGGVFVVGQVIESYVLTPKLIGERVGLHPVWIMFALFAGAALLGFTGMLLAIPAAASIGVLVRFAAARYRAGPFYLGASGRGGKTD